MEATWDTLLPSTAQQVKVETSPTGSLLSDPAGVYPSLFSGSTVASSAAATPTDTSGLSLGMFPASSDDVDFASKTAAFQSSLASLAEEAVDESNSLVLVDQENTEADLAAASDKKPAKKRKSWGQVLPEPKTNLPPRKRAKTEDEKEQRRVERVLRNRRAAQSSRERKRLEVEALEIRNRELEEQLAKVRRENTMLYERLTQVQGNVLPAVEPDSFALESGYLDSPDSGNSDFNYLVDNDTIAAINGSEFDMDDFFNADGPNQPSGGDFLFGDCGLNAAGSTFLHSAAQDASEDPDQQPHAGASY
ncbi:transcription factor that binds to CRE motif [Sporothrix bragantina]|uniref:Transcription factor that binds to CRE motif n=1 Tax=Sporothrix bragantina TaxID=671064 RepID=A0ABP0CT28_9PEZI